MQPPPAGTLAPKRFALFALGFRPFYLLAALFAAASVPVWVAQYVRLIPPAGPLGGLAWHMHEMVFGFAAAVITGFLFTAARNWTGKPTPAGAVLAALAALWLAARILLVTGPSMTAAYVDFAFLPAVAWFLWQPLRAARNRRNYLFVGLVAGLAALNLAFHFAAFGITPLSPVTVMKAALYLVVLIVAVMGGRVVPAFTRNALPGAKVRVSVTLDRWAIGFLAGALALDVFAAPPWAVATVAFAAAALHAARLARWDPLATAGRPILWILHLSYAWIPVGLVLLGASALSAVHEVFALHAFGIGAVAGMIVGMMTRTARGHTGRPLEAGIPEVFAYALVHAAALVRIAGGLAFPERYGQTLALSALFWSAAFAIYFVQYLPFLVWSRVDGKPG